MPTRINNVGIAVQDLEDAISFFESLGFEVVGTDTISGEWADTAVGLDGNHARIALLSAPNEDGAIELFQYLHPAAHETAETRPNDIGMHRIALEVDDLEASLTSIAQLGYTPLRGVAQYEEAYKLTYVRGPSGIIVMLAQKLS